MSHFNPDISICIITYNQDTYIRKCLESVIQQNFTGKVELIISDDNSNDKTVDIIKEFISSSKNIINVLFLENKINVGATLNIQKAFSAAKGKYIALLEGDDFWTISDKLQLQYDYLEKNPKFNLCYTSVDMINKDDKFIRRLPLKHFRNKVSTVQDLIIYDSFMPTCTLFFKNEYINYLPKEFFVLRNGFDWILNIILANKSNIGYIDLVTAVYRSNSSDTAYSSNKLNTILNDAIILNNAAKSFLNNKFDNIFSNKISNYYYELSIFYLNNKKLKLFFYNIYLSLKINVFNKNILVLFFILLPKSILKRFKYIKKLFFKFNKLFQEFLILYKVKNKIHKNYVLGRTACLGQDVFKMLELDVEFINFQKARIDVFENSKKIKNTYALNYVVRDDIKSLVKELSLIKYFFSFNTPKFILIDSYSELTDQNFVHNKCKEINFFCNFSDINHNENFKTNFTYLGLLDLNLIDFYYRIFFQKLSTNYPNCKIIFIHFPTKLDTRLKFIDRGNKIIDVIENLSKEFNNLYSIKAEDKIVDFPINDKKQFINAFPYHYNYETYRDITNKVINVIKC